MKTFWLSVFFFKYCMYKVRQNIIATSQHLSSKDKRILFDSLILQLRKKICFQFFFLRILVIIVFGAWHLLWIAAVHSFSLNAMRNACNLFYSKFNSSPYDHHSLENYSTTSSRIFKRFKFFSSFFLFRKVVYREPTGAVMDLLRVLTLISYVVRRKYDILFCT